SYCGDEWQGCIFLTLAPSPIHAFCGEPLDDPQLRIRIEWAWHGQPVCENRRCCAWLGATCHHGIGHDLVQVDRRAQRVSIWTRPVLNEQLDEEEALLACCLSRWRVRVRHRIIIHRRHFRLALSHCSRERTQRCSILAWPRSIGIRVRREKN